MIKNPNWQEVTSWLFTMRGRVESRTTRNKSWPEVRKGFEPGATACKLNTRTTGPRLLPKKAYKNNWECKFETGKLKSF